MVLKCIYKENYPKSNVPKIFDYVKVIIFTGHIFLIISQFTNLYYSFDSFNNYHRESGYIICYLFPLSATIIQYITIAKYNKKTNKRIFIPIVLYFTLPIISTIIQLFVTGISLTNITIAGVVIILYSFTIYDANMMLEEKKKTEADLKLANEIQQNEIPNVFPAFPERKEFDLYANMIPAKEVGGDFYDYFLIDDNHLAVLIADVSGKGVPAALNMIKAKLLLKGTGIHFIDPAVIIAAVNEGFIDNNKNDIFVTVWFGIIEISTGKLTFANAGHEDAIIYNKKNGFNILKTKHGIPIGAMSGYKYQNHEIKLAKGDKLFLYTDGVIDNLNKNNIRYGVSRLLKTLNYNKDNSVRDLINNVKIDLEEYSIGCESFDDITMLCFELNEKKKNNNEHLKLSKKMNVDLKEIPTVFKYFTEVMADVIGVEKVKKYYVVGDEVLSNIIKYGFKNDKKNKYIIIDLDIDLKKKNVKFTIKDNGIPFNPLYVKDPNINLSVEERKEGGLGIYIVKKMMDKVSYEYKDNNNILILEKKY